MDEIRKEIGPYADCPLPKHPELRRYAAAFETNKQMAILLDDQMRLVYMTSDLRTSWGDHAGQGLATLALGEHLFSTAAASAARRHRFGLNTLELWREYFLSIGPFLLGHTEGAVTTLKSEIDPALHDLIPGLEPIDSPVAEVPGKAAGSVGVSNGSYVIMLLRDASGKMCGVLSLLMLAAGMNTLSGLAFSLDIPLVHRMEPMRKAGQRPAALLFADLERSPALAARLGPAEYFRLGRRLVRAADQCVADACGLVGRHVGDGVVAFFAAESFASGSAAAQASILATRNLREAVGEIAGRSGLTPDEVVMRFGLHWGSSIYMGRITTVARTEVTALGDEVNEAARIEACATGGRTLASKALIDQLDDKTMRELGLDWDQLKFARLGDLETATAKARRDAPDIAVCEV